MTLRQHTTLAAFPTQGLPVQVVAVETGDARRYGVEVVWEAGWVGTITVEGPRGGVIHSVAVAATAGGAAFSGYADWPRLVVNANMNSGTASQVVADVYLVDWSC